MIHAGVYAVGHPVVTREGRWMAAVLAGGEGAVLSHFSAAALWGIRPSARTYFDITTRASRRTRRGIRAHRSSLPFDEITSRDGIPVTTVARTLLDLGAVLDVGRLTDATNEAEILRLFDLRAIECLFERYPRRSGTGALRAAIASVADEGVVVTRKELERRFRALVLASELPRPQYNATIELNGTTYVPDVLWRDHKLIVELDGRATHLTRRAFEADRKRDRRFVAAGYRVVRVTWRQLEDEPNAIVGDVRTALSATHAA
ncbi:MAG: DUF559 domain-containing protein [Thermoleophilaceae bacterium]